MMGYKDAISQFINMSSVNQLKAFGEMTLKWHGEVKGGAENLGVSTWATI